MNNDLISREALKNALFKVVEPSGVIYVADVVKEIDNAPTVEHQKIVTIPPEIIEKLAVCVVDIVGNIDWEKAIEAYKTRPQGKWIFGSTLGHGWMKCSNCCVSQSGQTSCWSFCPNCGADMRGGR